MMKEKLGGLMKEKNIKKISVYALGLIAFTFLLYRFDVVRTMVFFLTRILSPFIIGGLIAVFLNIPAKVIHKLLKKTPMKKIKGSILWPISIVLALIILVLIVVIVFGSLLPVVVDSVIYAFDQVPGQVDRFLTWIKAIDLDKFNLDEGAIEQIEDQITKANNEFLNFLKGLSANLVTGGFSFISSTLNSLLDFILGLIFSIYLLLGKKNLGRQVKKVLYAFLSVENARRVIIIGRRVSTIFHSFLSGVAVEATIYGLMSYIAMKILSMPFASSISMLNALGTFIPYFGAIIGGFIGFILIMTVSLKKAFIFLVLTVVLQQVEANLIYPVVVGDKVGLPGIWVMVGVTLGGSLFGLVGMLLSVPITTLLYVTVRDIVNYRLMKKDGEDPVLSHVLAKTNIEMKDDIDL